MSKRLEQMRNNPFGDWQMSDVAAVCKEFGAECTAHRGGSSHFKISHPSLMMILTIPARRPVKPVYIRRLVNFLDGAKGPE